ncbi:MAG: Cys-tRNA(Pro) deacylase [Desulfomonilia bacterium]|jgi:Cys-tRNA(Pro) deacylase|uniref:Cys-tRNA(Pro)/Cys-tRNA(Cys) deacylase n=1 Tax=anaerobic digester metagenome TaxID=1263854 RepID=A0A485LVS8_9ZZZZ|nr:Cys-tRNA(Pro) deacylase [Pseudomonadota bacterium]HON37960.1 Cys-tRNA(Pro) deacylase [Deltaproteobacteria bacterium]HRS56705.1 Cys-tRNA(Pro) deacylase [Desulfomonilia bacterium]HPD21303.1 Cys-tRNA(Pro) deacylase [Deltaproteobacteria bacterium]HPX19123.1 Cys-tRNA(Pro) deacylase [Deltaproteobacteria bacterium]
MRKDEYPVTQAVRFLRANGIDFVPHLYPYVEHGGTRQAALTMSIPEHRVIKTLLMDIDEKQPVIVLMHGDREVSTKALARLLGVKRAGPCDVKKAQRCTGYQVGGISPFGTRERLRVFVESSILELDRIFINGGKRGFMVEMDPRDLEKVLKPERVSVATVP